MAHVEGTLGAMLQGVSQQPAHLRASGQVSEQINYDSDVSTGLTSRPGTVEVTRLVGATQNMMITRVGYRGKQYWIGHADNEIALWNSAGEAYAVTVAADPEYLTQDMVFLGDEKAEHIKCLSRNVTVAMDPTVAGRSIHAAVAVCLGGIYNRRYFVTVVATNGDSLTVDFTTPDGSDVAHDAEVSASNIMKQLKIAWDAATKPAGLAATTVTRHEGVLLFVDATALKISAGDGDSGSTMRVADSVVKDVTHLPETSAHGHTVRVQGGDSVEDDFYLTFDSDVTSTVGAGFGKPGKWRETADPDSANSFDRSTLPHRLLVDDTAKTGYFDRVVWQNRRAGDATTNPEPVFVGERIRDMTIFEGRLAFVSGDSFYASSTEEHRDMWRKSATTSSPDDPISIRSTAAAGAALDWIVPFDRDLLLVSDPGSAQFLVRGGGLTPDNASMVLSTSYEVESGVRPVSTGRTIILPFKAGIHTGIHEFFTQTDSTTNAADPLTAVQATYIVGSLNSLSVAQNFSRISMTTPDVPNVIWVYRYLWDAGERLQSAWYKLEFADEIRAHAYDAGKLYVVVRPEDDDSAAVLTAMDMNRVDDSVGFHITLDRKRTYTVADGKITVPISNAAVVQSVGCSSPGLLALVILTDENPDGTYTLYLDQDMCPDGATVVAGQEVRRLLRPTMPHPRDHQGNVVSSADLIIRHFKVRMHQSPDIKAVRDSVYRAAAEFYPRVVPEDSDPLDPTRVGRRDYILEVPWRERYRDSTLTLTCSDTRPDTILEVEWAGDIRGVRRRI